MPISTIGSVNVSALSVPQALIQIVPPQYLYGGASTNSNGWVGTASWGPVNLATVAGSYAQFASLFGPTINRLYDLGSAIILAQAQGAQYHYVVRVTDGTDTAATLGIQNTAAIAATAVFTETASNNFLANDTITVGNDTFKFVSTIGATAGNVLIGGSFAATAANLVSAIMGTGGSGTTYIAPSSTPNVTAAYTTGVITFTAITAGTAGNSLTSTYAPSGTAAGSFSGSTFSGGAATINCITFTGKYTGSLGNSVNISVGPGTQATSYKVVVYNSYLGMEVFDNLAQGLTGNAVWTAIASAINSGASTVRPASNIIVASAGTGTASPATASYTLVGGTDGVTTITTAKLLGTDSLPRSGMYALRGAPIARFGLVDCSDSTSWSSQLAFAISINAQAISTTPASDTLTTAATELNTAGIDSPWIKVIFGDWIIWQDTVNGVPTRMSSPIAVAMGIRGNMSPQRSILNKPINGIVGTQSSILGKTYSQADFQALAAARLDVVALDPSLTNNFIFRLGLNTSSSPITHDDAYTDVTDWLAVSIQTIANQYIGAVTTQGSLRRSKVALQTFLALAQTNGIIGTFDGSQAYQVVSDTTNNTQASVALGYRYAYVKAIYLGITRFFIVNLEGGASVTISNTLPGQTG